MAVVCLVSYSLAFRSSAHNIEICFARVPGDRPPWAIPAMPSVVATAADARANGLSQEEALAIVTTDAAKILGVDNRVGSLESGKDADMVLFDGDPFEYTSHVTAVIINGKVVSQQVK